MRETELALTKAARSACALVFTATLILAIPSFRSPAAENEPPAAALPVSTVQETNSTELLRSYLQLQEQLHGLQLSIEENRKQADAAAANNAEGVANRLRTLEQTLSAERARDLETVTRSNRMLQIIAYTFGIVVFLAMLLMAYQWRTVSRLAEAANSLPASRQLGLGTAVAGLGNDNGPLLLGSAGQSNARLLEVLDRIEKGIHELEQTGQVIPNSAVALLDHGHGQPASATAEETSPSAANPNGSRINVLIGKGQSLLNLDKAEEALACFEEVLATEPGHTDALIKKAAVLERLRKLPEAIECYDRAIAADSTLTIAYLYKGGLFNRMDRFEEALECYEQALRAQDGRS